MLKSRISRMPTKKFGRGLAEKCEGHQATVDQTVVPQRREDPDRHADQHRQRDRRDAS
jgi:hypothetical protein